MVPAAETEKATTMSLPKRAVIVLKEDDQSLADYGLSHGNLKVTVKDLGPQMCSFAWVLCHGT